MPTVDPPWPGPLQPWDGIVGRVSSDPAFSPWTCKHCGKQPIPDGGPHWCPASAAEAHEKAIADAVALLGRNSYVVTPKDAPPAPEPWTFDLES